jgi:hypothetical protein
VRCTPLAVAVTLAVATSCVQAPAPRAPQDPEPVPAAEAPAVDEGWTVDASAYTYFTPDEHEYVQPTVRADRGMLHLEARYDYEALDTGSRWVGCNLGGGEDDGIAWELTPMLGGVSGDTRGVAPGYEGSVAWRQFEFYVEGEYVIDTDDSSDSFFYNCSELTFAPVEVLRLGLVAQRTRAYDSERDVQRGFPVALAADRFDLAAYVFDPDVDESAIVVSARGVLTPGPGAGVPRCPRARRPVASQVDPAEPANDRRQARQPAVVVVVRVAGRVPRHQRAVHARPRSRLRPTADVRLAAAADRRADVGQR